jgi:His-Xaa-Ser system protein HxsD
VKLDIDAKAREVSFSVPSKVYSMDALRIAAATFESRCESEAGEEKGRYELTLRARKSLDAAGLEALAGEFANELLNQEYRFVVAKFNRKVADLIAAQTLLAARGGENPPAPPAGEDTPEFKAEVQKLLAEAAEEIRRTMPPRIAPQGSPIPPEKDAR